MNEFNLKASGWDDNPMHWERSKAIAEMMQELIPYRKGMKALEYGAGTGILSFMLKYQFDEITLMDSSTEMLRILSEKISQNNVTNFKPLFFDLEHSDYQSNGFDIIFTQMVLHHVMDVESIIGKFQKLLNTGGYLAIADLYPEDGSFHGDGFNGHLGFDLDILSGLLSKKGFTNIIHKKCYTVNRKISDGTVQQFPVFLLIANKV